MEEINTMSAIDFVFSVFPAAECFFAAALLFWVYTLAHQKQHRFLHVFFVLLGVFYLMSVFFYSGVYPIVAFTYVLSLPITLSLLPAFYLYLLSVTNAGNSNARFYLFVHYLPSILFFLALLPFWLLPTDTQIAFVSRTIGNIDDYPVLSLVRTVYKIGVFYVINIQFVVYLVLMIRIHRKHRQNIEERFSFKELINLDWMIYSIFFFAMLFVLINFSHFLGVSSVFYSRLIFNIISIVILFYLFIKGFTQRNIYLAQHQSKQHVLAFLPNELQQNNFTVQVDEETTEAKIKYSQSGLSDDKRNSIFNELNILVTKRKVFLNSDLDIDLLATVLQTNSTWLSQIINEMYGQNFFNFVNKIRIEEACEALLNEENNKYTLEALAKSCGFNSRSSFHSAFKKFTGATPSEYRRAKS